MPRNILVEDASEVDAAVHPYGFLLPKSLRSNFNSAHGLVEVRALPNYVEGEMPLKDLADFRTVLGALSSSAAHKRNRDAIFLADVEEHLDTDNNNEKGRRALDIIEGKSAMGLNLAVLRARTLGDKAAHLFVVEDRLRDKMIVAGPGRIADGLRAALAEGGLRYVVRNDEKGAAAIDRFILEGAKLRGEQGLLLNGAQGMIDELVRSLSMLCTVGSKDVTMGAALHATVEDPSCYTQITRA